MNVERIYKRLIFRAKEEGLNIDELRKKRLMIQANKIYQGFKDSKEEHGLADYEYLLHHVEVDKNGKEIIHHCFVYDHIANMYKQSHLYIKNGKVYLEGKQIKDGFFHVIIGLESDQEVAWSNEEAEQYKIKPKLMKAGMTFKEKAKEW